MPLPLARSDILPDRSGELEAKGCMGIRRRHDASLGEPYYWSDRGGRSDEDGAKTAEGRLRMRTHMLMFRLMIVTYISNGRARRRYS